MPEIVVRRASNRSKQSLLKNELDEAILEFNGTSVRPSMVIANRRKNLALQNEREHLMPKKDNFVVAKKQKRIAENFSLKGLLAALSFSPRNLQGEQDVPLLAPIDSCTPKSHSNFSFDSVEGLGSIEKNVNVETPESIDPLARESPISSTAGTLVERDEHSSSKNSKCTMSPSSMDADRFSIVEPSPLGFASPSLRKTKTSRADAVAMAYPLSLPVEVMRRKAEDDDTTIYTTATAAASMKRQQRYTQVRVDKPAKKFPRVCTDIPGAGTRRSGIAVVKTKSTSKLPFVHMVNGDSSETRQLILSRRNHANQGFAHHLWRETKDFWAWSKGNGAAVPLLNLAEGIVSSTCRLTTGNGDLEVADRNLMTPAVAGIDEHVINPIVAVVVGIWSRVFGEDQNPK